MPIDYACQRCTACCRWPGQVRLTADEVDLIAAYMSLDINNFIECYPGWERIGGGYR